MSAPSLTQVASGNTVQPAEDELARRKDLYDEHRQQAWHDIQTETDNFDRNLLALSTSTLVLSLGFIKDIVPLKQAVWLSVLYVSWVTFALCILVTVASFRVSILAHKKQLDYLWKFYMERDDSYFNKKSFWSRTLKTTTWAASLCFVAGMACTVAFAIKNVMEFHR